METRFQNIDEYRAPILISPGDILQDFLDDYSMSQVDLSNRIGVSKTHINQLIKGSKPLTQEMAKKISTVFNTTTQFWMKLEIIYRSRLEEIENISYTEEETSILGEIPYAELVKRGYAEKTRKLPEKILEMRKFFMVSELARISTTYPAFRKAETKLDHTYSLLAWQRIGEIKAKSIESNSLNLSKLNSVLKKIRELTVIEPDIGYLESVKLLNDIGIVLVLEKQFPGSGTNGMVFLPSKKNRVIILLSVRNKYADIFWFTLFHELAHLVLYHEENIELNNLSGLVEERVNTIAGDLLIPREKYQEFLKEDDFSMTSINRFSQTIKIHPCIIIGRLQYDKILDYSHFNSYRPKLDIVSVE